MKDGRVGSESLTKPGAPSPDPQLWSQMSHEKWDTLKFTVTEQRSRPALA
jgi:hypothetical protein